MPSGTGSSAPHQSGASAAMVTAGVVTIRSGSPMSHSSAPAKTRGGGRSAGLPRGAPASTQRPIVSISAALSETSSLKSCMPMVLSMNQGGILPTAPVWPVRCLMLRAQGRTSSYVISDIGAMDSGRWQCWQLRCRIGAMSFV